MGCGGLEKGVQGGEREAGRRGAHHQGLGNRAWIWVLSKGRDSDRKVSGVWDEMIRFMMYKGH